MRDSIAGGINTAYTYDYAGYLTQVVHETGTMTRSLYAGGAVGGASGGFLSTVERWNQSTMSSGKLLSSEELSYGADTTNTPKVDKTAGRYPTEGLACAMTG